MSKLVVCAVLACLALVPARIGAARPQLIDSCGTVITAPGVYRLSQDLICELGEVAAIRIEADDVTIHLNGHTIHSDEADDEDTGIVSFSDRTRLYGGGTIANFDIGILLRGSDGRVSNLTLINNDVGMDVGGSNHVVTSNLVVESVGETVAAGVGIRVSGLDSVFRSNQVIDGGTGILADGPAAGNLIQANRAFGNVLDAGDAHGNCDATTWTANRFGTVDPACIE